MMYGKFVLILISTGSFILKQNTGLNEKTNNHHFDFGGTDSVNDIRQRVSCFS